MPSQETAARRIADLLRPGGRLVSLENIADHDAHMFPRSPAGWTALFEGAGLRRRAVFGYAYDVPLRLARHLGGRGPGDTGARAALGRPAAELAPAHDGRARELVYALSAASEPLWSTLLPARRATHCAFVFER